MTSADRPRIDIHVHFVPDFYRDALVAAGLDKPDGIARLPSWNEASALQTMDELGVRTAMLSISSPGVHFGDAVAARDLSRRVNEEAARLVRAHPGRFGFFASTPLPDVKAAIDEVQYALDVLGADGVALETNHHGVYLGDERLEPLYAEIGRRSAVVFIHPTSPHCSCGSDLGYPRPMLEFMFETTRSVTNLILSGATGRYPGMRVVVPHAGAALPVMLGRIELLLPILSQPGRSMPDVRAEFKRLHFDLAGAPVPELLGALLQVADPTRIHYGSDWPFTPTPACVQLAGTLDATELLADKLRDAVMSGNSERLFPRLATLDGERSGRKP